MLKVGLAGVGHLGKIHLKLLLELKEYIQVVGFYDTDAATAAGVAANFNVPFFENIDELIGLCDALDIVTPTISHYEIAVKALKKSKHVFIEKPIANTIEEAKSLISLSREANVKLQIGHVERFNPAFTSAKSFCSNPMFIETHRLAQFNPRGTDVSVVLDLMIHDIDIILNTVSSGIRRISASGVAVISDTPDIANARIEFDNGCVANLTASRISMKNMRKTRLFQRDAYISIDFLEKEVSIVRLKTLKEAPTDPFAITIDLGNNKGIKQIYFEKPNPEPVNAIKEELRSFANAIKTDSEPLVTGEDGYKALDVAYKIIDKLKNSADIIESQ